MSRRSHTTPRVYLRQFTPDNETLCVYDKAAREYRLQSVNGTGIHKDFYAIVFPDGRKSSDGFEKGLDRLVENPMRPMYDKLKDRRPLSVQDMSTIFNFVAVQKLRVPAQRRAQERRVKEVLGHDNQDPNLFLRTLTRLAPAIVEQLIRLNVRLLLAPLGYSYITGDDPFCIMRERDDRIIPAPEPEYSPVDILSQPGARGFMPLSSKICFFVEGKGSVRNYREDHPINVNQINRWIAYQSQRFLYAADQRDLKQVVWGLT